MKLFSRSRKSNSIKNLSTPAKSAPAKPKPLTAAVTCPACGIELQPDVLE